MRLQSSPSWSRPFHRLLSDGQLDETGREYKQRVSVSFWLFGLINNILYVIILSSALDLVGTDVPKGLVLLADVFPSFLLKLVAPYFIHRIPYDSRIWTLCGLSSFGMLTIAASSSGSSLLFKLCGILLASLSSGGGELSFLGLTHHYGQSSLAMWSSGTGGAGILGAGAYVLATVVLGLSPSFTLLLSALLPMVMLFAYFVLLPRQVLRSPPESYQPIPASAAAELPADPNPLLAGQVAEAMPASASPGFYHNLARVRSLFFPYMLPLLLVYIAEYTINQGVAPTLLFPIEETPFANYRDFYPTYNAIYQLGVFISRSSQPFFRIHMLYTPSFLQILNLCVLVWHAISQLIPSVYLMFIIIFWEGLLGGIVYVTTFAEILDNVPEQDREFSLSATTVSDSGGILISSLISMVLEVALCDYQVANGRPYCKLD